MYIFEEYGAFKWRKLFCRDMMTIVNIIKDNFSIKYGIIRRKQ